MSRSRVITASDDGVAIVWCFGSGDKVRAQAVLRGETELDQHTAGITSVSVSPDGSRNVPTLLTSSYDKTLKLWSLPYWADVPEPGSENLLARLITTVPRAGYMGVGSIDGHKDYVTGAEWCPDGPNCGRHFVSWSEDGSAMVWDATHTSKRLAVLKVPGVGHEGPVSMAKFTNDGRKVLTCSHDTTCILWDPTKCSADHDGGAGAVVKRFGTRPDERITNTKDAKHTAAVWSVAFSPDGTKFVSTSKDTSAIIWNVQYGKAERTLGGPGHEDGHKYGVLKGVYSEAFPHSVLTCSLDGTARLWDFRKPGDATMIFNDHTATVWSALFGNEPYSMATASHDMTANVYDLRVDRPRSLLVGHTGILWQASYSEDDRWLVTCSEDCTGRVWDLSTGVRYPPFEVLRHRTTAHTSTVTCAAFLESSDEMTFAPNTKYASNRDVTEL